MSNFKDVPAWKAKLLFTHLIEKLLEVYRQKQIPEKFWPKRHSISKIAGFTTGRNPGSSKKNEPWREYNLNKLMKDAKLNVSGLGVKNFLDYAKNIHTNYGKKPYSCDVDLLKSIFSFLGHETEDDFFSVFTKEYAFDGYYYSAVNREIKGFEIEIISALTPDLKPDFVVSMENGFHDNFKQEVLVGPVLEASESFVARLQTEKHYLDLYLHIGTQPVSINVFERCAQLYGIITGNTSRNYICTAEVVLAKKDFSSASRENIHRYLNLRRRLFAVDVGNGETLYRPEAMTLDGVSLNILANFSGKKFRILTAGPGNGVIQSLFIVKNDYSAEITVPEEENNTPMNCVLSFNNIQERQLLVSVYTQKRILYSRTVIYIPKKQNSKNRVLNGAFLICNKSFDDPIGNIFVMCEDNNDFEPKVYPSDKISELTSTEVGNLLYDELNRKVDAWIKELTPPDDSAG